MPTFLKDLPIYSVPAPSLRSPSTSSTSTSPEEAEAPPASPTKSYLPHHVAHLQEDHHPAAPPLTLHPPQDRREHDRQRTQKHPPLLRKREGGDLRNQGRWHRTGEREGVRSGHQSQEPHHSTPALNQTSILFHPNGSLFSTGGDDKTLRFFSLEHPDQPEILWEHDEHVGGIRNIDFNGKDLYVSADKTVVVVCSFPQRRIVRKVHHDQLMPPDTFFQSA